MDVWQRLTLNDLDVQLEGLSYNDENSVFDAMQLNDFAQQFHDYGTEKIQFPELAKIWEDNKYEVIIEPSALFWTEMAEHWPKTKFIHLTRDLASWKKSLQ